MRGESECWRSGSVPVRTNYSLIVSQPMTRLPMVTPSQKHSGEWRAILAERERIKAKTFAARRAYHVAARGHNKVLEADIS